MRIKTILLALLMLIACKAISQEDTIRKPVCFSFNVAQQIALDLEEKDRLSLLVPNLRLRIANYESQLTETRLNLTDTEQKYSLLQNNYEILESQYEAEQLKQPKSNWFIWTLGIIGALGVGYTVGNLN